MAEPGVLFENAGYCSCCRSDTMFRAYDEWLRDHYVCSSCGSIPRQRHIQFVLDRYMQGWEDLKIHESSPSNDFIGRHARDYTSSQFFTDVPPGDVHDGVRCEDIENLTFGDATIDVFITQDVLEHVFNPERAIQEIHRVLSPGGAHVFTAPKHKGLVETVQRARLRPDGSIDHLCDAEYHGSPIGDHRVLVTHDYGQDFETLLSRWSGASAEVIHTVDRSYGLDAEFNEVFVIRKLDSTPPRSPLRPSTPRRRRSPSARLRQAIAPAVRRVRSRIGSRSPRARFFRRGPSTTAPRR